MSDARYWKGNGVTVPPIKELCASLQAKFEDEEARVKCLEEENRKLKEGIWEQEEVARLKEQNKRMKHDYYQGFPISDKEKEAIDKWHKEHQTPKEEGFKDWKDIYKPKGSHYLTYYFNPTSLGVCGKVKCSCGQEFEFQSIG